MARVQSMREDEVFAYAKELRVPVELVEQVRADVRVTGQQLRRGILRLLACMVPS